MQKIVIASGPVIVEDKKVLLVKQGEDDFWKFCGGLVKENENLKEAATRRAKEELGIDIEIIDDLPFITYVHKDYHGQPFDILLVHFKAKINGNPTPGVDVKEWQWINLDNLPMDVGPNISPALMHFGFLK